MRSAAENRIIAEAEKARKVEEERLRKEAEERENVRMANNVLMLLVDAINTEAEKGGEYLHIEWKTGNMTPFGIDWDDYDKAIKYIRPILESAGYRVDERYRYSGSWANRSGNLGHTFIWWNDS